MVIPLQCLIGSRTAGEASDEKFLSNGQILWRPTPRPPPAPPEKLLVPMG